MVVTRAGSCDLVFLVPGFLGFERFGNFGYFADRVTAALRACLEDRLERTVYVVPVPILPTGSFAQRQSALLKTLLNRMAAFDRVDRVHLVGHSTGGIDAHLLTLARPIGQPSWASHNGVDGRPLRERLRSVVSIGTPHQGTCLADDPVALFLANPGTTPTGLWPFGSLLGKLIVSAASDVNTSETLLTVAREGHKVWKFFFEVLRWNDLIDALRPDRMEELYHHAAPDLPKVQRSSFVTIAGLPDALDPAPGPDTDAFFDDMWMRTSGQRTGSMRKGRLVDPTLRLLEEAVQRPEQVIISHRARLPAALDLASNDGVVNSARQLINPHDPRELEAVVVADHFDVVGYYDRAVWVTDAEGTDRPHQVMAGLLHSGSQFGDDEFFKLYRYVARAIARATE